MQESTHYAFVNAHDGIVTGHGKAEFFEAVPQGATVISPDHFATLQAEAEEGRQCRLVNGVLRHLPLPTVALPSLEVIRETACARVDNAAEEARLRIMTGGAGQRAEYDATAREAALVRLIPPPEAHGGQEVLNPDDYPHLQAEVAALAAVGIAVSVRKVADAVMQLQAGSAIANAWIKQVRRTAKLRIAVAPDAEAVAAVLDNLDWTLPKQA